MPDAVRVVCADDEADIRSWRFYIRKETRSCTYDDSLMTFLKVEGHFLETLEQNLTRHAMQPPLEIEFNLGRASKSNAVC